MHPPVVLVTNATAPDKLGGLERYVRELAAALVRCDVPTTIVAKRLSPDLPPIETGDDGVTVVRHAVPAKRSPLFAVQYPYRTRSGVRTAIDRRPGTVIHGHFPVPMLAMLGPGRSRRPYLYTFHAPVHQELLTERQGTYLLPRPLQRPAVELLRRAEAAVVGGATAVTVLSEYMREQLAQLAPQAADAARLIPGGVDTDWFSPPRQPQPDTEPLIFTARRLTPRTGVVECIAAMPAVLARHPGARLVVAGDGHLRTTIERQISSLGLEGRVDLLGRVSEARLREGYRSATLTVMPTAELEGFGLTTAESLACGTPVLVTPVGANPELVGDLDPRFVARSGDPADLADAMIRLLDNRAVLAAARRALPGPRVQSWSWPVVAGHYIELYARQAWSRS
ncbi:glycosyltransferase family 4 protein [Dactylosporangium vinaceum]|uniref:Glycosyltransferase family 4 protein n=1 Tax=Dactylosporangium vinaceum TaxID=53362 RepID=A0ABV5MIJ9_9ACTN|nr:glycosyltransferase family 4 protein [Dactylosporangium vinaceum]UAB97611.1 glycosyltransferase family 4 protein [Dactylosporangium vinaceum]